MPAGRPPKPAVLKLIEGRGNGKDTAGRPVKQTPGFVRLPPTPPTWLPTEARDEWERVVPELQRVELLKPIDGAALTSYCLAWARLREATEIVAVEGMVIKADHQGRAQRHPALLTAEAASKELRAWCSEFGLTPSAEQRVGAKRPDDGDQSNPFAGPAAATG
jgi:P27 family predicted phage terminase small subunit